MPRNAITLTLNGEVSLDEFAKAMRHFTALIETLSKEVAKNVKIEWIIEELHAASTSSTVVGLTEQPRDAERVAEAVNVVGQHLREGQVIPYSKSTSKHATNLTKLIDGRVNSIIFQTDMGESVVTAPYELGRESPGIMVSLGIVRGTIQTLMMRGGLQFTLYDSIFDKAVKCFLSPGQEDIMRNMWGMQVVVAGRISRHPATGQPISVRDIKYIKQLPEVETYSYTKASRVLPTEPGAERPEDLMRRLRDAQ